MKQQYLITALLLAEFVFGSMPLSVQAGNDEAENAEEDALQAKRLPKQLRDKKFKLGELGKALDELVRKRFNESQKLQDQQRFHQQQHEKKKSEMEQNSEEKIWEKIGEKILKVGEDQRRKEEFETALSKCRRAGTEGDALLELLGHKRYQVREAATKRLTELSAKNAETRKKLEDAKADEDPEVRVRAQRILEEPKRLGEELANLLAEAADDRLSQRDLTLTQTELDDLARKVKSLVQQGADVNTTSNRSSELGVLLTQAAPLVWAAQLGDSPQAVDIISLLIKQGADVNAGDGSSRVEGWTPLHHSAWTGSRKVTEKLIASGANPNSKSASGTPLHSTFDPNIISALIKAGANPNTEDWEGMTPLYYAVLQGKTDRVEALLRGGANPNTPTLAGGNLLPGVNLLPWLQREQQYQQHRDKDSDRKIIELLKKAGAKE